MLNVLVCTQSRCKHQAAEAVLSHFQSLVLQNGVEDLVRVSPSRCLGVCHDGVTIQVGQHLYTGITEETMDFVFEQYVLDLVKERIG